MAKKPNRYQALIEKIFLDRYKNDLAPVSFERDDLVTAAKALNIKLPKNLGDVIYAIRYRNPLPATIQATQPKGKEWVIFGAGIAKYIFRLVSTNRIVPNPQLVSTKIPDATPEIVNAYALTDEQALLAKLRYNRLLDIFLGLVAYPLQSHLRTTVTDIGQVEIDEIYVAIDRHGRQFVMPVQAKGGSDQLSVVQTDQDISCCSEKYPDLICRPISAQFMDNDLIALFELAVENDEIKIVEEKHYKLVPADQISKSDLTAYAQRVP